MAEEAYRSHRPVIHEAVADIDAQAAKIVLIWTGSVHSEIRLPRLPSLVR
jgi:hypothetical protein